MIKNFLWMILAFLNFLKIKLMISLDTEIYHNNLIHMNWIKFLIFGPPNPGIYLLPMLDLDTYVYMQCFCSHERINKEDTYFHFFLAIPFRNSVVPLINYFHYFWHRQLLEIDMQRYNNVPSRKGTWTVWSLKTKNFCGYRIVTPSEANKKSIGLCRYEKWKSWNYCKCTR